MSASVMLAYRTPRGLAHYESGSGLCGAPTYRLGTQRLTHQEVLDLMKGVATMQPTRQAGDQHYSHRTPEKVRRGVDAPGAKLSAAEIAEIYAAFDGGSSQSHLARKYQVSRLTIWRHLKARGTFQM